jgi:hypothetical protein
MRSPLNETDFEKESSAELSISKRKSNTTLRKRPSVARSIFEILFRTSTYLLIERRCTICGYANAGVGSVEVQVRDGRFDSEEEKGGCYFFGAFDKAQCWPSNFGESLHQRGFIRDPKFDG